MAADNFTNTSGSGTWDTAANWSAGTVPQAADDATVNTNVYVTIAATDPAYTVKSLSMTGPSQGASSDTIQDSGSLTVLNATTLTSAIIDVFGGGKAAFSSVALGNSGGLAMFGTQTNGLTVNSLSGTSSFADFYVASGSATIGTVTGTATFNAVGGTLTVGTTSGSGGYILQGGALRFGTTASNLADNVEYTKAGTVDLTALGYQAGETVQVTQNASGSVTTYTAAIKSSTGATLFTFNSIQPGTTNPPAPSITVSSDANGGTLVSIACYTPGTLIRTPSGETEAGALRIGDMVSTLDGKAMPIVWLGRRSYAGRFLAHQAHVLPVRIRANALGEGLPRRDLLVSPCHAMFLEGVLVPARCLINGTSITQDSSVERVDYVHIELETHAVLLAEGAPSESFVDDGGRMIFHNAAEYAALYPQARRAAPVYCAPRVVGGEALAAIRSRIDRLAGLTPPDFEEPLRGRVDAFADSVLSGWAQNPSHPEAAICLDILVNGIAVTRTLADRFRPDLLAAGLGSGCHSFRVRLPRSALSGRIEVRRALDSATIGVLEPQRANAA